MRPVILVQRTGKNKIQCSLRNTESGRDSDARTIKLDLGSADFTKKPCAAGQRRTEAAGAALYAALCGHRGVKNFLNWVVTSYGDQYAITFEITPDEADALPWEALKTAGKDERDHGFIALNPRFTIAREEPTTSGKGRSEYGFYYPVKFMAVLSSTKEVKGESMPSALEQWEALQATLHDARATLRTRWRLNGEPLSVLVLTNDAELHRELERTAEGWIDVDWIESARQVVAARTAFQPHLLHLFCHGSAAADPRLILGTLQDFAGERSGSIRLSPQELAESEPNTWLVTLSSCSGAESAVSVQSFARQLARCGTAAVVGMRDAINTTHARLLSEHFYPKVFEMLGALPDGTAKEVDWAFALTALRGEMRAVSHENSYDHADCLHWTIPVMYRRAGPFQLTRLRKARTDPLVLKRMTLEELREQREMFASEAGDDRFNRDAVLADFDRLIARLERRTGQKPE